MERTIAQEINEELESSSNLEGKEDEVEQSTEQSQKESEQSEQPEGITEEYVKENGLSDSFIGKSWKELGKAYSNSLKSGTKLAQEISELRKSVETLKATPKEEKKAEKETVDEFGTMPDAYEEPEKFKTWMKEFKSNLTKEIKNRDYE